MAITKIETERAALNVERRRRLARPSQVLPTVVYIASDGIAFFAVGLASIAWIPKDTNSAPTFSEPLGWIVAAIGTMALLALNGLYTAGFVDTPTRFMLRGLGAVSFVGMLSILALSLTVVELIPEAAIGWMLVVGLFALGRLVTTLGIRLMYSLGVGARSVLVVGHGLGAAHAAHKVEMSRPRLRPAGQIHVDLDDDEVATRENLAQLQQKLQDFDLREVLIAAPSHQLAAIEEAIRPYIPHRVTVRLALYPLLPQPRTEHVDLLGGDFPTLRVQIAGSDRRGILVKRLMDVTVGLFALTLAVPVMAMIALMIRLDSKGPVLFRQSRVGQHGSTFTMYKFRSMRVDAESMLDGLQHLNEAQGLLFKVRGDPRVTRVGKLLRKLSLDELPQLFNVLEGTMSLVGPRPALPVEAAGYEEWQVRRLSVLPGITGLWQVTRRQCSSFEEMIWQDLEYVDNWSLALDVSIALKTIPAVLTTRGAY